MSDAAARDSVCRFARSLFDRGLTPGSSGNITLRLDDGGLLSTPTNVSLGNLDPALLSRLDQDGRLLSGAAPTKELALHGALYATRKTARAIVHLHSTYSVAVSMLPGLDPNDALPPLTAYYLMRVGRTALLPYFRPGDPAVAAAIHDLDGRYGAILLSNHGPVVTGDSLDAAVAATEELEETAKLFLLLQGRTPRLVPQSEVIALRRD